MKNVLTKSGVILLVTISFYCCKKYPDDEHSLHLNSVNKRLCRDWSFLAFDQPSISFREDGYFWADSNLNNGPFGTFPSYLAISESTAKWDLIDHKEIIRITNTYDNQTYDYTIKRLDKDNDGILTLYLQNDSTTLHLHELTDH